VGALEDPNIAKDHDNQGLLVDNQRFASSIDVYAPLLFL
jgi:hypothetical protein